MNKSIESVQTTLEVPRVDPSTRVHFQGENVLRCNFKHGEQVQCFLLSENNQHDYIHLQQVRICVTLRDYVQRNSLSVLRFKVLCAIYGRRIHHPEVRLARPKLVLVTRGVKFSRSGNFPGTFLCFLHGNVPVKPTRGT